MGQKSSSTTSLKLNSSCAKQLFKDIQSKMEGMRRDLLGIYQIKTKTFTSAGDDLCAFIDILNLLKASQSQYKAYLTKIAQYIDLTITAKAELYNLLHQNIITNEKTLLQIQVFLLKIQDTNSMKYSAEYLFQLGKEIEELDEENLSTCVQM